MQSGQRPTSILGMTKHFCKRVRSGDSRYTWASGWFDSLEFWQTTCFRAKQWDHVWATWEVRCKIQKVFRRHNFEAQIRSSRLLGHLYRARFRVEKAEGGGKCRSKNLTLTPYGLRLPVGLVLYFRGAPKLSCFSFGSPVKPPKRGDL